MAEIEKKVVAKKAEKVVDIRDLTTCDATAQMLAKARRDGVETAFDRALSMKACPIGADSACCKHCSMGPCRLNAKDPYGKVGVCGATIDTIQARNFARMVTAGSAAHTDHGMCMLELFREEYYRIKVGGCLSSGAISRLPGLAIQEENGHTVLTGPVADQNSLYDILLQLRDHGHPLLSVQQAEPDLEQVFVQLLDAAADQAENKR